MVKSHERLKRHTGFHTLVYPSVAPPVQGRVSACIGTPLLFPHAALIESSSKTDHKNTPIAVVPDPTSTLELPLLRYDNNDWYDVGQRRMIRQQFADGGTCPMCVLLHMHPVRFQASFVTSNHKEPRW